MEVSAIRSKRFPGVRVLFTLAILLILSPNAHARLNPMTEHLTISASSDFTTLHPGESGILAITLTIEDGWHTYWPGVSDSGFGLSLAFDAPDSITLDDPIWPTPKRHLQKGNILDHVYEDSSTILVPYTISPDAEVGDVVIVGIKANYLVCDELCLPGKASASTSLTVIDPSSPTSESKSSKQIRAAFTSRPVPFDPSADDVRVQWIAGAVALMFRDATKIEFFPAKDCTELAEPIKEASVNSNRMELRFTTKANKLLSGRLRVFEPTGIVDYDIHLKSPTQGAHHP